MTLDALMRALAQRDIQISAHAGQLAVSGAKGALTPELREQLRRHKDDIIARLDARPESAELIEIRPDPEARYQAFPFSDLQVAFFMADDPFMEFHVRPHYYCEQDWTSIDIERYEIALNKALRRHAGEIVLISGDRQLQVLRDVAPVKCKINDLRNLSTERATAELLRLREQLSREQLPLDRWPWFDLQVSLWREENCERARLHFNQNNFYTDGYGATVLQNEVDRYYEDPGLELPPLSLSVRDAILGLEALTRSPAGDRARRYWLERLPDLPEPPPLPQVPGVSRRRRSRLWRRENLLSAHNWKQLKQHAALHGLTPSSAVIAAYAEVLSAWSGSRHFILSNMVTRRLPLHKEIRQIVGNFASLYPLEVDLRGDGSFAANALRLQRQILRDAAHLQWGGMQVMQAFNRIKGELGSVPCPFVVGSGLFMGAWKKADFSCLETSQTMLDHQFWELDDGRYYYVWDLLEEYFPAGMIDAMWHGFDRLLRRLATDAGAWGENRLEVAPAAGHAERFVAGEIPDGVLHDALARAAAHTPDKAALVTPAGTMSYAQLDRASAAVAHVLRQRGVAPGDLVALVMDRGPGLVAATLGVLKTGAAYVPLDAAQPGERLRYMLGNSRARVVLTDAHYQAALDWPAGVDIAVVDALASAPAAFAPIAVAPTDLAYVIYTSGSTGDPKGVMIDHRGALNTIVDINRRFRVGADDRLLGVSSFSFDLSVYDVFGALHAGATLVYPEPGAALNPAHWLALLLEKSVTVWNSAPPLMSLLVETALRQDVRLPALRLVLLSGDWIPVDLPALIGKIAPNATVVSLGGATEASIWSIYHVIEAIDPDWTSIPYGKPLTNQGWDILDPLGRPTPTWAPGELYVSGVGLARGYWRDETKTRERFLRDPATGAMRYRTGDRGRYRPDGSIEFLGRLDAQVKIQGHRIELGEIETALGANPAVKQAVVLAPPAHGERRDDRARQLVAYVVPSGTAQAPAAQRATIESLQDFLKQKLPEYMVPKAWALLERMPLTPNGKLDRKALAKVGYTSGGGGGSGAAPVAPRTPLERELAAIWCLVLGRDAVSVNQDFFDIGGQSFDAVRCVGLIQERLHESLSLGDVWQARTIENLARQLARSTADSGARLVPINTQVEGRPYFWVHPAGGQVTGYYELGRRLARPSYGFIALAADVDDGSLATIEHIAQRYVAELRVVQPHGPYTLGGWSSGACIAFEMARQLEHAGAQVDRVFVFDAPAPLVHMPIDEVAMLRGFLEDLDLGLPLPPIHAETLVGEGEARFARVLAQFESGPAILSQPRQLYEFYRVFQRVVDAVRAYRPQPIRAEIVLARAADGVIAEFAGHPYTDRPDWGWALLTSGPVYAERLRGTHHTLLQRSHVDAVARVVNGIRIAEPHEVTAHTPS